MSETLTGSPAQNYVGGEWRESASGESYEKRSPWRPSLVTGVYPASDAADGRAAVEAAREAFPAWAALPPAQRAAYLRQGGGRDRGPRGADRPGHDGRDGQAAPRGAPRGAARRDDPPLRRRRGVAADSASCTSRSVPNQRLYTAAPAARRGRPDHAVELPDRDPRLEARACAGLRQHGRPEARLRGAAHRPARRRVLRRGGTAGRRAQRADGRRLEGRAPSSSATRGVRAISFTGSVPVGPRRARRGDRARLPRPARARRPQPAHRHGRRRARPGGRGGVRRRVLVGGAEVHGDPPHPRPGRRLRRVPRAAAGADRGRQGRRSRRPRGRGRAGRRTRPRWRRSSARSSVPAARAARCSPAASAPTTRAT